MSETIVAHNVTFIFGEGAEHSELTSLIYGGAPCELSELGFRLEASNPTEMEWQGDPKAKIDADKMNVDLGITITTSRGEYALEASSDLSIPVISLWEGVDSYPYIVSENERLASAAFANGRVLLLDPKEELSIRLSRNTSEGHFTAPIAMRATIYGQRVL